MWELRVRAPCSPGLRRESDLRDDLARRERGLERALEELSRGDVAAAARPDHADGRLERERGTGLVGRGIRVRETSADGPSRADLEVADGGGGLGERGEPCADRLIFGDGAMRRERADDDR